MTSEIIDKPLTREELGSMYQRMCEDPYFANIPGKIELDMWGRIVLSPASTYHGMIQAVWWKGSRRSMARRSSSN